jgi:hemerythrin superfamily protein
MTESKDDLIGLLLEDHREAEELMAKVEKNTGKARQEAFQELVYELARHETAEEEVVYPALRRLDGGDAIADARIKEEEKANKVLAELEKLDITSNEWATKFSAFQKDVLAHAQAEEKEVFPRLRQAEDDKQLEAMGKVLQLAKATAPTHPHPNVPGTATANLVAGPLAAIIDRTRDAIRDAREKLAG